jgi:hypothetical protein
MAGRIGAAGRRALLLRGACLVGGVASAMQPAVARPPRGIWFDPTQLPSYTGRLERWVPNPGGEVDRALLREGAQLLFPPSEAEAMMAAVSRGQQITAWGIRARSAPVVTVLAWGREGQQGASFVERPAWFASDARGTEALSLQGKVLAPLLTPQGAAMGVMLEEGGSIRIAAEYHVEIADMLEPGRTIAATGLGKRHAEGAAIDADAIGESADKLQPVPANHR